MPTKTRSTRPKADKVLTDAVEVARAAAVEISSAEDVGEHLGVVMLDERLAMHQFACERRGYQGWHWSISVARAPRAKIATVCEANLLPGDQAVLSPEWLPYAERLAPGDIGAGDITPYIEDDPRLEAGFEATGDEDVDETGFFELGLGRPRVLSAEGRDEAAQRWYDGAHGPTSEIAVKAPAQCTTCGFFLPMAGALRQVFGVCTNAWSPSDGAVVSLDHGCGAHSEVELDLPSSEPEQGHVLDEFALEVSEPAPAAPEQEPPAAVEVEPAAAESELPEPTDATSESDAPDDGPQEA
ncbi:DUF3027 domain-containing protein [Allobranchiibius huperziae]|uniref:DUF3027 domain-containing protein n=1 Tax=Allobranchiibius huperziae TaxID=1874116 RepID=A0A853DC54_9MICO|nr:DUF3027 domain-containing protein [Allobranchiibius huperziae]NYJ73543.1 hypothetical protein [Allobranchiibius huperziae]